MELEEDIFAFVLMPFDDEFDDKYQLGIKEAAEELDVQAERVDEQIFQEGILERIYRQIETADIIISDMSGQNPNVFYEVGYAHALNKLCLLLTEDPKDIPFDLQNYRHVIYDSIEELRKKLKKELNWAKEEIIKFRSSNIKVELNEVSGIGNLETSNLKVEGKINFEIDLHNETDSPSAKLENIYFYSTDGWTLFQNGKECPSSDSDIEEYAIRHFLEPPVERLQPGAWAQLNFDAEKVLAWGPEGDEIKESYNISGHSIIRLVTNEGQYDYDISIDTSITEIPF